VAATRLPGQDSITSALRNSALCYEPGDVASLAAGIRTWCEDRERLDRDRRASWQLADERYNWDIEKQTLLAVIESVISNPVSAFAVAR